MTAFADFIASVKTRDFAKASKFKVTMPTTVGTGSTKISIAPDGMDVKTISLYCEQAALPGIEFDVKPYHIYGPHFQRPQGVSYDGEGLRLQFLVDQDMKVKELFDNWMVAVNDPASWQFNYPVEYMSSGIVIQQLKHRGVDLKDGADVGTYAVRLIDAFPRTIEPMQLNYANTEFHRLGVVLAYSRWIPVYGKDQPPSVFPGAEASTTTVAAPTAPDLGRFI
jgi:hypothetical protein